MRETLAPEGSEFPDMNSRPDTAPDSARSVHGLPIEPREDIIEQRRCKPTALWQQPQPLDDGEETPGHPVVLKQEGDAHDLAEGRRDQGSGKRRGDDEEILLEFLIPETTGLVKTRAARVFSDPQATPAEARVRRLKGVIDALLLRVMRESLGRDGDQARLASRVERARAGLESLNRLTPNLWCRRGAYAVFENDPEKATEITDRLLMQGFRSVDTYLVAALAQLIDRRFQEAREALIAARALERCADVEAVIDALDTIVSEHIAGTPYRDGVPERTYVLADQHNHRIEPQLDEVLRGLGRKEDVIVIQDRQEAYDIKRRFGDKLCSVETEHRVWERYEGDRRKIRLILKNNNYGNHMKSLKMGIRKALGAGAREVLTEIDGVWSIAITDLVRQADGADLDSRAKAIAGLEEYAPAKRVALLGATKEDCGQGVPIVMANIVRYLSGEMFTFSYIVNDYDSNHMKYFDETGKVRDFQDRAAFLNFIQKQGIRFDVLHFHSWHYSDHYKPFKSERDAIGVEVFIEQLGKPKVIYTDHSNPTEDLRRIHAHHGINYGSLSDEDKEAFLQAHGLGNFSPKYWKRGWDATSILSKRQMMLIADRVTHVSAAQRAEEAAFILPNYKTDGKHVVVWNGTDMIPYRNLSCVRERAGSMRKKRNGKSVLYVGRAEREKGIFDLAIAAAKLHMIGAPVHLVFVGSFDKSLRMQLDMASGQRNSYPGRIDDRAELAAQYLAADLIAQPTWGECFNQVVSEGLALGTPSVVSDISGPREVYVANGIAIGHQPRAPMSLAQGIKRGLNDGTLRREIVEKGQRFVEERLSAPSMVKQYAEIYRS
ncbi:MAG: glycosyltransferase family 4 protein [Acetobacteraceae bacterium]|nr:glycosyltransferase family 4 protein [Acetobacteraceae bacterium]